MPLAFAVPLVPSPHIPLYLSLPFLLFSLAGTGHLMIAAHNKVEASLDLLRSQQTKLEDSALAGATAKLELGEACVTNALSLISLQSLITLLQNPQVKLAGSQPRLWLQEVAEQYAQKDNKLLVVLLTRRCHNKL